MVMDEYEGWIEVTIKTYHGHGTLYLFVDYQDYDLLEMEYGDSTNRGGSILEDSIYEEGMREGILYNDDDNFKYSVKIIRFPPEEELNKMIQRATLKMLHAKEELKWLNKELKRSKKSQKETEW